MTVGAPVSGISAAPGAGAGRTSDAALYTRLTYLTAFRLVIVTALLGATIYVTLRPDDDLGGPLAVLLYGLVTFVYAVSLGYLWVLRARRQLGSLAYAQVAGDVLVATFLVYLTGGADSLFVLMYPLAIVNASVLLHRAGAITAAASSAVLFAILTFVLDRELVGPAADYLSQRPFTAARLGFVIIANGSAFVLTAALATYLTEQLRRTGERLTEREVDYAALSELHGSIVRSMSAGIVTTDVQGRVTFMNPAAEQITGLGFGRLVDEPLRLWLPALAAELEAVITSGGRRGEVEERDAAGGLRRLGFVVTPLSWQRGGRGRRRPTQEQGLSIIVEDRTAMRAMEETVRRSDRLAAVGQLAAGLAHELRNPLASMSGAVELLTRGSSLNDAERRLMGILLRETERLNGLVTDFLAFARPMPVVRQPTDVAALVDETLRVFEHSPQATGVELSRTGVEQARLEADPAQLRQVLWNLLQNAVEAMGPSGRVVVDVARSPDGGCRVAVSDAGPGVPAAELAHLFEPFYTTKPQGTGLGLALVHRIVDGHGGRIEVSSGPGGTTFTVLLPATGAGAGAAAA